MSKQICECAYCGTSLRRYLINTVTKLPFNNFFCDMSCKGKWQTRQRELLGFTKEWLIDQYINQKKGAAQIGREIGRDPKRVWEWIRDYGIETRPRGHDTSHLIMDGSTFRGKKHTTETKERIRQISLKDGRVPWGKNNAHPWKGVFGENHPSFKGGLTPERQAVYSSQEWVDAVKVVWARDNATCQNCGKHHNTESNRGNFHVHHIISFQVREFQTDPNNLILLCKECHKFVHSKKNTESKFIKGIEKC